MERGWLEEIRRSDELRKRRWITAMSALTLAMVAFVWIRYFNSIVRPEQAAAQGDSFSFWQTASGGAANIAGAFRDKIDEFKKSLSESRNYTISPSSE